MSPESSLTERLRQRDPTVLDVIVAQYGDRLMRAAASWLRDPSDLEDVVQETLIAAWDGGSRLIPGTDLEPWLFGILTNRCRKHLRATQRRERRHDFWRHWFGPREFQEKPFESEEAPDTQNLRAALDRLPEGQREVLILRHIQGLDLNATAQALGIPEGTVKSRCSLGLQKMREILGKSGGSNV